MRQYFKVRAKTCWRQRCRISCLNRFFEESPPATSSTKSHIFCHFSSWLGRGRGKRGTLSPDSVSWENPKIWLLGLKYYHNSNQIIFNNFNFFKIFIGFYTEIENGHPKIIYCLMDNFSSLYPTPVSRYV